MLTFFSFRNWKRVKKCKRHFSNCNHFSCHSNSKQSPNYLTLNDKGCTLPKPQGRRSISAITSRLNWMYGQKRRGKREKKANDESRTYLNKGYLSRTWMKEPHTTISVTSERGRGGCTNPFYTRDHRFRNASSYFWDCKLAHPQSLQVS